MHTCAQGRCSRCTKASATDAKGTHEQGKHIQQTASVEQHGAACIQCLRTSHSSAAWHSLGKSIYWSIRMAHHHDVTTVPATCTAATSRTNCPFHMTCQAECQKGKQPNVACGERYRPQLPNYSSATQSFLALKLLPAMSCCTQHVAARAHTPQPDTRWLAPHKCQDPAPTPQAAEPLLLPPRAHQQLTASTRNCLHCPAHATTAP